jgi:hypothetical protein
MDSQGDLHLRNEHLLILAMAATVLVCSLILQPGVAGTLVLPIPGTGAQVLLPGMCLSRGLLGIPCPGCGLTRSFVAFSLGDIQSAFHFNAMGPVLYIICLMQIPYRVAEYFQIGRSSTVWSRAKARFDLVTWFVLAGLVVQWVVRILWKY